MVHPSVYFGLLITPMLRCNGPFNGFRGVCETDLRQSYEFCDEPSSVAIPIRDAFHEREGVFPFVVFHRRTDSSVGDFLDFVRPSHDRTSSSSTFSSKTNTPGYMWIRCFWRDTNVLRHFTAVKRHNDQAGYKTTDVFNGSACIITSTIITTCRDYILLT